MAVGILIDYVDYFRQMKYTLESLRASAYTITMSLSFITKKTVFGVIKPIGSSEASYRFENMETES